MECRRLKSYKGYEITKSWEKDRNGNIIKSSIIYDAVEEGTANLLDSRNNLSELKRLIDNCVRQ